MSYAVLRMTELVATTPGLFPLPDWAKAELSDRKGHQKEDLVDGDEADAPRAITVTGRGAWAGRLDALADSLGAAVAS